MDIKVGINCYYFIANLMHENVDSFVCVCVCVTNKFDIGALQNVVCALL